MNLLSSDHSAFRMTPEKAKEYCVPFLEGRLPERQEGNWRVAVENIPAGKPMPFVTLRTGLFTGLTPREMSFPHDREMHSLLHQAVE